MKRSIKLLPQVPLSILLALSLKPRHGYEIIKQVEDDSEGRIRLGPGALYSTIKSLKNEGLIEMTDGDIGNGPQRIYYQLTQAGRARLADELTYFRQSISLFDDRIMRDGAAS